MANMKIKSGQVTGTGSAINVECGFTPALVILANETDPGAMAWFGGMADGEALKLTDAVALTFASSNGISAYAGAEGATGKGFTIGADSDMNAASDVIHYIAIGGEQ